TSKDKSGVTYPARPDPLPNSRRLLMDSTPENELWVVCPVCHRGNPPGTRFCRHCWGAVINPDITVTSEELKEITRRRKAYLKRNKIIKRVVPSLASLLIVFLGLYYFTDIIFKPPKDINSGSLPGEWAMFRHDLGRSGSAESAGVLPQGTLKWVFSADGPIHSSPAIADGTVYFGSQDYKFYALDADSGAKRWEYETGSWVESSPAIANGVVYFGSNDGGLYARDAHSGEKIWDFKTKYPIKSSPAVADGTVYCGSDDYNLYALDVREGKKLWSFNTHSSAISPPVVSDGIVYIGSGSGYSYALNALNGQRRLRFNSHYGVYSPLAVSDGIVYFINDNGTLYAFEGNARTWLQEHEIRPFWLQAWVMGLPGVPKPPPQSGFLWLLKIGRPATSSPVVVGDTLYIGADNKLFAIDLQSQQIRWEFVTEGAIRSSPAVVGSAVFVGSGDGQLYAVDTASGRKLWDFPTGNKISSSPAVANGIVYIGSHDGNLYAIE
ncbi:MAG: PQQ-binding-like beta-propeller repeat protein, partial [Dehalococcoidia bacterium]